MRNVDYMMNVMAAYANGNHIEFRLADVDTTESDWSYVASPTWNWHKYEYRIAPSKKESSRFMTNGQLSELLQKGYGTWSDKGTLGYAHAGYSYSFDKEDDAVTDKWIRPWGSKKWIEPTVDIYDDYISQWSGAFVQGNAVDTTGMAGELVCDIKDYSYASNRMAEPELGERFLYKGGLYKCIENEGCSKCAFECRNCDAFNCNLMQRKDGISVNFVECEV